MHRRTILFVLFASAYVLSQFYRSTNAVIAPDLAKELSLNAAELGLMTSLFFAMFAVAQIPVGVGLDRWGPRWVTSSLMWVGVVGSLVFAVAHSFGTLALGRALLGLGMAGILMGAVKAFSLWYPANRFATMTGLLTGIGLLGALLSATPLVWLNSEIGWRAVFVVGAIVTGAVAMGIALWTRNTPPGMKWEARSQSGSDLPTILSAGRFWRIALFTGFVGGMVGAFRGLWAGPYLFDVLHSGKIETGNLLLLMGIGSIAGSVSAGWLTDRLGIARVAISLTTLCLLCQLVLVLTPALPVVGLVYVLLGLSSGVLVVMVAHSRLLFPATMTGQVVSLVNLFAFAGTFLLQWGMGLMISAFPVDTAGHYPPQAYTTVLLVTALGTLLTFIVYLPLTRTKADAPRPT
jgi:predicted MFS family arabinose efflux permease